MTARDAKAKTRLAALYPEVGPWTSAALWHGLAAPAPPPDAPLELELDVLRARRLSALLLGYLRELRIDVHPQSRLALQQSAFTWTTMSLQAAAAAGPVTKRLDDLGIAFAVSKGPGIASLFPQTQFRPYSDIDLVMSARNFGSAVAALEHDGWYEERRNLQPWPYFRRYCREGVNLRDAGGGSVDVHHRAPPWVWSSGLDVEAMTRRTVELDVAGTALPCLDPADNLLVVALHVVSDRNEPGKSLMVWRDLATIAKAVDTATAVARAEQAGLSGWLRAVLRALPAPACTDEVRALIDALPDAPIEHPSRLSALLSARAADYGVAATQTLRLPVANGLSFLAGMAVPSAAFVRAQFPEERHPYRHWWFGKGLR